MPQAAVAAFKVVAAAAAKSAIAKALIQAAITVTISAVTSKLFGKKAPRTSFAGINITTRSALEYQKIAYGQVMLSGPIFYNNVSGETLERLHTVVALAGHQVDAFEAFFIDANEIPETDVAYTIAGGGTGEVSTGLFVKNNTPTVFIRYYDGDPNQTADAELSATFPQWDSNHRARGVCYAIFETIFNSETAEQWEAGAPTNYRARVRGRRVYDPRQDSTNGGTGTQRFTDPATWVWSDNPAVCTADYLTQYMNASFASIDWATVATAADYCDETVTIPDGSGGTTTQRRFVCNGALTTGNTHKENIEALTSSMVGRVSWAGGQWRVFASQWVAPTVSFTANDFISNLQIRGTAPRGERFNTINGFFANADNDFQPVEFQPVTRYLSRDNNEILNRELELPMTTSDYMCQRIAYRLLDQGNQQTIFEATTNAKGLLCQIGDTVDVTVDEMGWSAKTFRVISWRPQNEGSYQITFKEDDASAYNDPPPSDYTTALTGIQVATDAQVVPAPSNLTVIGDGLQHSLTWTDNARGGQILTEVWVSDSNDRSVATRVATLYADALAQVYETSVTRYYWIRNADLYGRESEWFPTSATAGISATGGGAQGGTGDTSYWIEIFARNDSETVAPALPTTTATYTISDGSISFAGAEVWEGDIPTTGGDYVWRARVPRSAASGATTIQVINTEWQVARLFTTLAPPAAPVRIQGEPVFAFNFGADSTALFELNANGQERHVENGVETFSQPWLLSGVASDYQVRYTPISGTVNGPTVLWSSLSSSQAWSVTDTTDTGGAVTAQGTIEIQDVATTTIQATAVVTLSAERGV